MALRVGNAIRTARVFVDPAVRSALLNARAVLSPLVPLVRRAALPVAAVGGARDRGSPAAPCLPSRPRRGVARLVSAGDPDLAHLATRPRRWARCWARCARATNPYISRAAALRSAHGAPPSTEPCAEFSPLRPAALCTPARASPSWWGFASSWQMARRMLPCSSASTTRARTARARRAGASRRCRTPARCCCAYGCVRQLGLPAAGRGGRHRPIERHRRWLRDRPRPRIYYLTGLSMGGIGAAGVAFHHPDRSPAIAPLCGCRSFCVACPTRAPCGARGRCS